MSADDNTTYPDLKVLLVEDNVVNQKVTTAMLKHFSIETDIADNGQVGIEMAKSKQYDMILMDCQMPVMNGFDATLQLRKLNSSTDATQNDIPILAMTANASPEDVDRCIEVGMNDVIAKPVELNTLLNILKKWVNPEKNTSSVRETKTNSKQVRANEVLDDKVIKELYDLMGDDVNSVFDAFLQSLSEHMPALEQAVEAEDLEQIATISHTLKGSSANIGANKFSSLSKAIMELARAKNFDGINKLLHDLIEESAKITEAIKNISL
ncbi:MAG: response regulator [Gammaproteobacteria bacterium]|nr:response regulator [Gammaproteobacteria bacterium]